jgi:ATP-binding cassette subfamily B protein
VRGRTTIAVAHRLSTLRRADRLVVLDRGEVVEIGPHDELMAREGAYFRLYQAQARNVDASLAAADWTKPADTHSDHVAEASE